MVDGAPHRGLERGPGRRGRDYGHAEATRQPRGAGSVIAMLVGEHDRAEPGEVESRLAGAALDLSGAETRIDEQCGPLEVQRAAVARRS